MSRRGVVQPVTSGVQAAAVRHERAQLVDRARRREASPPHVRPADGVVRIDAPRTRRRPEPAVHAASLPGEHQILADGDRDRRAIAGGVERGQIAAVQVERGEAQPRLPGDRVEQSLRVKHVALQRESADSAVRTRVPRRDRSRPEIERREIGARLTADRGECAARVEDSVAKRERRHRAVGVGVPFRRPAGQEVDCREVPSRLKREDGEAAPEVDRVAAHRDGVDGIGRGRRSGRIPRQRAARGAVERGRVVARLSADEPKEAAREDSVPAHDDLAHCLVGARIPERRPTRRCIQRRDRLAGMHADEDEEPADVEQAVVTQRHVPDARGVEGVSNRLGVPRQGGSRDRVHRRDRSARGPADGRESPTDEDAGPDRHHRERGPKIGVRIPALQVARRRVDRRESVPRRPLHVEERSSDIDRVTERGKFEDVAIGIQAPVPDRSRREVDDGEIGACHAADRGEPARRPQDAVVDEEAVDVTVVSGRRLRVGIPRVHAAIREHMGQTVSRLAADDAVPPAQIPAARTVRCNGEDVTDQLWKRGREGAGQSIEGDRVSRGRPNLRERSRYIERVSDAHGGAHVVVRSGEVRAKLLCPDIGRTAPDDGHEQGNDGGVEAMGRECA
jgi:hypothetical protein